MNRGICYNVNVIVSVINGKGIEYHKNVEGKRLSLFKSGGTVDLVINPSNARELSTVLDLLNQFPVPYYVLGNGSNTLIGDKGFRGIIILLSKLNDITFNSNKVFVGAGVKLPYLAHVTSTANLEGLERLSGIPCSIGGATIKNAGCYGVEFGSLISKVLAIKTSNLDYVTIDKALLNYSYRSSNNTFDGLIVTGVELELAPSNKNLGEIIEHYAQKRRLSQPNLPSLGSTFIKPSTGISAGYYIDKAGLKGTKIGGAQISEKHANFIVNIGNATSCDYLSLAELATSIVKRKFDIDLTKEIDIIGVNDIEQ